MTQLETTPDVTVERREIDAEVEGGTLPSAFEDTVSRLGDAEALKWREDGAWRALTWNEYRRAVAPIWVRRALTKAAERAVSHAVAV